MLVPISLDSARDTALFSASPVASHSSLYAIPNSLDQTAGRLSQATTRLLQADLGLKQLGDRQNNRLIGSQRNDLIRGKAGNDQLSGRGGADQLFGDQGNDLLKGGAGDDRLTGGSGKDILVGGAGNDSLSNDSGTDQLTGGAGADRFILRATSKKLTTVSIITDFDPIADSLQIGATTTEQIHQISGAGRFSGSTILQNNATGEYLVVLKNLDSASVNLLDRLTFPPSAETPTPNYPLPNPADPTFPNPSPTNPLTAALNPATVKFSAIDSEATIAATGAASLKLGTQTLYIGTQQVSSTNQNPIIASFDSNNPANQWVKTNYEMTGADGRGYGLFWSGTNLYGLFSVDGTQGTPDQDFRRVSTGATQSWLRSYGQGGGAKVAVLARLNPATGEMLEAAYLSAILSNGNSNSFEVTGFSVNSTGNLVIAAKSWFAPRQPDGKAMTQLTSGSSPFNYSVEITPDLRTVISTGAIGWA